MSCVHQYHDDPDESGTRIVFIANIGRRYLCCMKCGFKISVDKSERWQTIVNSWLDNGLHPQDWSDYQDTCYFVRGRIEERTHVL